MLLMPWVKLQNGSVSALCISMVPVAPRLCAEHQEICSLNFQQTPTFNTAVKS